MRGSPRLADANRGNDGQTSHCNRQAAGAGRTGHTGAAGGDGTFTFVTKAPPAAVLLKKEAGIEKGSPTSNREKVGKVTRAQLKKIAEIKMQDLNATDLEGAINMIAGTARSMGLTVEG